MPRTGLEWLFRLRSTELTPKAHRAPAPLTAVSDQQPALRGAGGAGGTGAAALLVGIAAPR